MTADIIYNDAFVGGDPYSSVLSSAATREIAKPPRPIIMTGRIRHAARRGHSRRRSVFFFLILLKSTAGLSFSHYNTRTMLYRGRGIAMTKLRKLKCKDFHPTLQRQHARPRVDTSRAVLPFVVWLFSSTIVSTRGSMVHSHHTKDSILKFNLIFKYSFISPNIR